MKHGFRGLIATCFQLFITYSHKTILFSKKRLFSVTKPSQSFVLHLLGHLPGQAELQ